MNNSQKGIGVIAVILGIFAISIVGAAGAATLALTGQAPVCPTPGGPARSENAIGDTLEQGSVTITDAEATTLAQRYVGNKVSNGRVCFTEGLGHISGKIKLDSVSPSFYVSGGVDLTGSTPKATNLNIQLGSLPNLPFISAIAEKAINKFIGESLEQVDLNQRYSATFTNGSVTIRK